MEQTKYRIGNVANMVGVSRDTLRHYEKIGILSSRREESGYRYYTESDIARLVTVLYQRKMNIGLDEIADLSREHHDEKAILQLMKDQLAKEEQNIRRHRQNIARIRMSCEDFENILSHQNQIVLKELPSAYLIVPHTDISGSIPLWFRYAAAYPGMDMMYVLDEYSWEECEGTLDIAWRDTSLILKAEMRELVDYPIPDNTPMINHATLCLSTFVTSKERVPSQQDIRPLLDEAKRQGLLASHQVSCTFTSQDISTNPPTYYLQIYLPVF
ncbi:MAG: MerR family transcriptional regulator [Clostridiales bacterium]|nr:MerR family transcriptional regulator [Clostridiales bacterium]